MSEYLILGLLGHPLSHSLSPALHNAALQFAKLKGEYSLFDIEADEIDHWLKNIYAQGVSGFNVSIPYKQRIYKWAVQKTKEATLSGAVNTVKIESDGQISGHNTDVIGFQLSCKEAFNVSLSGKSALIIGAGGAARAVIVALAQMGLKKIQVKGRDFAKVSLLISEMEKKLAEEKEESFKTISLCQYNDQRENEIDLVINASPLGLVEEPAPNWLNQLIDSMPDDCLCFDLVYGKDKFKPMVSRLAIKRGLQAIDGLPMLIHQARFAFEYWTGINVPSEVLYRAIE